ncbi:MAG: T9SS type A sorting domain-containing protein, partial [Tenuifilaceae bacterium]|nr:T9SS type A sorting domain-containing protein [Tenuifilaceae bacterium]
SLQFTFTPDANFHVASVLVDGVSVGLSATYTFSNIHDNHTISVTFTETAPTTHAITATAGANGTISPSGEVQIGEGEDITFAIAANSGYNINDVSVDGVSVGSVQTYTFENVTADHTIEATFTIKSYTLTYTAGVNGSLDGNATQTVDHGADGTAVTAVPNDGYHFVQWSDGVTANPRTDANVIADVTVTATFEPSTQVLTLANVANGTLSATPTEGIVTGSEITITVAPDAEYKLTEGSLQAYKTEDENVAVTINEDTNGNLTLIMPAFDVTVTAAFESTTGVNDATNDILSVYPNPAKGHVHIKGLTTPVWVEVYSLTGKKVMAQTVQPEEPLNLSGILEGVYIVRIKGQTFKLLVNK